MAPRNHSLALIIALLALLAGALAASACGGDSKEKATPTVAPKATTQATQVASTPKATTQATQAATTPETEGASVDIKGFAFDPKTVTVKVGQTVTWTNQDSVTHTVTGDGGIDSGDLSKGKSYSKTFDAEGTFDYHCTPHPQMTGKVIVEK